MPDYRTPLPGLLAATLETAINRILALDDASNERLQRLDGRMLRLDLQGLGIELFFAFNGPHVEVGTRSRHEPDTVVSGSPFALFSMAAPDQAARWGEPASRVTISGDATLARDLERLFAQLDPDWEGRLARLLGDVWGHQVAAGLRAGAAQARQSAGNAGEMLREYLQGSRGPLARTEEIEAFGAAVDELGADAERLEARLRKYTDGPA
ncbi:MAG: SCP2 sterol-binding domain-containing protein [Xanthomonadales bacterium]|nr:SCP2 sterol-binding domain-containing protein [Xanthomonadales bacterium]